jgi:predicted TIM-barrel fold metal-dependent hydrolase
MSEVASEINFAMMRDVGAPRHRKPELTSSTILPAGTIVVSADSHFSVSEDIWYERFPANMKDRAPRVWHADGVFHLGFEGRSIISPALVGAFQEFETLPGNSVMEARLQDMDKEGVEKEVVFGNATTGLLFGKDLEARDATIRIYNEYLAEFGSLAPGRFHGVAYVNYWDDSRFEKSIREVRDLGLKTFMLPQKPGKNTRGQEIAYASEEMDDFWSFIEESGLPVCFHIGENAAEGRGGLGISFMMNLAGFRKSVGELIFGGIFDRHPKLRVAFMEGGINWGPAMVQDAELIYGSFYRCLDWKLAHEPRYYWDKHCYVTFMTDQLGLGMLDKVGADRVMWAADYPHAESTFGYSWTAMREIVAAAASEADARKMLGGTAMEFFAL